MTILRPIVDEKGGVVGRKLALVAALALAVSGCGGEEVHPDVTAARDAGSVEAGAVVWEANCAECHGDNLEGAENEEGIEGPALVDAELGHPDADFVEAVTEGEGDDMPAFADELSSEEILSVVDFVRSFQAANLAE